MNVVYYDNDMHVFKCLSLSVKSCWWVTMLTRPRRCNIYHLVSITTSPWLMTTNFINISFALFSLDPVSLTLLSLCCWKSHTSGLLSWRNWDEALLEEFIRAWWGGYLKRIHPPNPRITVWIRMRDVLLLQKFFQVREFRIWQKDNLLFQQTLFTGVIVINNRQESLSCNRFEYLIQ